MKINKFEDIKAWQESRILTLQIYKLTELPVIVKNYGLKDQIRRAAVSVMNNIAEGFERQSNAEFIKFLYYAKGSAGELRSLFYVLFDNNYIDKDLHIELSSQVVSISKLISKFISYLEQNKK